MIDGAEPALKKAERAKLLIHQAALLLSKANASQRRIGWLLEDCADMLSVELYGRTLGKKLEIPEKQHPVKQHCGKNGKSKFKPEIVFLTNSR